jgi:hypothetical protein
MRRAFATTLTLALLLPVGASAQVWDAPSFMHAGAPSGLTLALTDSDPGDGLGFLAIWRRDAAPIGLGFRGGIAEAYGDGDLAGLFGIDVSGALPGLGGENGPSALWWTGGGVTVAHDVAASFPLGLVFGWTLDDESVAFIPYVGAHVVLDVHGDNGPDGPGRDHDNLDLGAAVDLGLDLAFPSGWVGRFGAAFGDRESLGIGFRVPTGR